MSEAAKRFYKSASVEADGDAFVVKLDARTLRTPGGAVFRAPTRALAEACAAEWESQGEHIRPSTMPLTQLAFAAVDSTLDRRAEVADYVAKFAETDLCCHRADAPAPLVARQAEAWDPLVAYGREAFGLNLPVVTGIIAAHVPDQQLARVRELAGKLDAFRLTALAQATGIAGSVLIGLAFTNGRLNAEQAYAAATLDEQWSIDNWGEDAEARARLDRLRSDFAAIERFLAALA